METHPFAQTDLRKLSSRSAMMEGEYQSIPPPPPTSSKATLNAYGTWLGKSLAQLVRKRRNLVFEKDPILYLRLLIRELDFQMQEQRLHKTLLDAERCQLTDDDVYSEEHRKANETLDSFAAALWSRQMALRKREEEQGLVPTLGPDSSGFFIPTLLALYKDPPRVLHRRRCGAHVQSRMKKAAVKLHEARKGAPMKGELWCPVLRAYYPRYQLRAVHIVPHALGPELVDYIFGMGAGSRLDSTDNCLLLHEFAGRAFEDGHFVLVPADKGEWPVRRWMIRSIEMEGRIFPRVSLAGLDGQEVLFKNDNRPASRFLYYHFVISLLRSKRDRRPGWQMSSVERPSFASSTPGPYMRHSMLLALAKAAGAVLGVRWWAESALIALRTAS